MSASIGRRPAAAGDSRLGIEARLLASLSALLVFACAFASPSSAFASVSRFGFVTAVPSRSQGWSSPCAVAVDEHGDVWALDRASGEVSHFAPDGSLLSQWGRHGSAPGELDLGVQGGAMTVGPDGLLYIADSANDRIQAFDFAGNLVKTVGSTGSGLGRLSAPMGIAFDDAGRMFVSDSGNDRVEVFAPDGSAIGAWTFPSMAAPRGIAVAEQDGQEYVYIADQYAKRVIKAQPSADAVTAADVADIGITGGQGSTYSRFASVTGIRVDEDGYLWICGSHIAPSGSNAQPAPVVERDDLNGTTLQTFFQDAGADRPAGSGDRQFAAPVDVAFAADGTAYVADADNGRLVRISGAGGWLEPFGGMPALAAPGGVALDGSGRMWVADPGAGVVRVYAAVGGAEVAEYNGSGAFVTPTGVAVDPSGDAWVSDSGAHNVWQLGIGGALLGSLDPTGAVLMAPSGVAVDSTGSVYVADSAAHRVAVFPPSGTARFIGGGGLLSDPEGVAVDRAGRLFVADAAPSVSAVRVFSNSGADLGFIGGYGASEGSLISPHGVAVTPSGEVLVADTGNNRVEQFDASGNFGSTILAEPIMPGNLRAPAGIACDSAGRVFVAQSGGGRVSVFATPRTSASVSPATWVRTSATVSLDASGVLGVAGTFYSINGGAATTYSGPFTISDVGVNVVSYWSVDPLGDVELPRAVTVVVDHTAPDIFVTGVADGGTYIAPVTPQANSSSPDVVFSATLDGAPYTFGNVVSTDGSHTITVSEPVWSGDTTTTTLTFAIHRVPPTGAFVVDGGVHSLNYFAVSIDSTLPGADEMRVDGGLGFSAWTAYQEHFPLTLRSGDGVKTITVELKDTTGNVVSTSGQVVVDTYPPSLAVYGVADGGLYDAAVIPTAVSDDGSAVFSATIDGQPVDLATPYGAEGEHDLVVTARDPAGNVTQRTLHFAIDLTPPPLDVTGVEDGGSYNTSVTPNFSSSDLSATVSATLNGVDFPLGSEIGPDGQYTLQVRGVDPAGNVRTVTDAFTIDRVPPSGSFKVNGAAAWVNALGVRIDSNVSGATQMRVDGGAGYPPSWTQYAASVPTTLPPGEGARTVKVEYRDAAGNVAEESCDVVVDTVAPGLVLEGVADGALYNGSVIATATSDDASADIAATLDGAPYYFDSACGAEGSHVLTATATDPAGNVTTRVARFRIDLTPPDIEVTGVANGGSYGATVSPDARSSDGSASFSATLNGQPFALRSAVGTEGAYTLVVCATDPAGNSATTTALFTIDRTPPAGRFSVDGGALWLNSRDVSIDSSVTGATEMRVNGGGGYPPAWTEFAEHIPATLSSGDGTRSVWVQYRDAAGNSMTASATVHLDTVAPDLSVSLTDGALYNRSVTLTATSHEAGTAFSATLNGWPIAMGAMLSDEGPADVVVTATDKAGNATTREVWITIDRTPPGLDAADVDYSHAPWIEWFPSDTNGIARSQIWWDRSANGSSTMPARPTETTGTTYRLPLLAPGGTWYFHARAEDNAGNWSQIINAAFAEPSPTIPVTRLGGSDRYAVATRIAAAQVATGTRDVILASGEDAAAADPLSASGLSWAYHAAPVLLTHRLSVPTAAKAQIASFAKAGGGTLTVHVVGGTGSVPDARYSEIYSYVRSHAGASAAARLRKDRVLAAGSRYDLAAAIASRMKQVRGSEMASFALVANGADPSKYFYALAASPIAAHVGAPILLVAANSAPLATSREVTRLGLSGGALWIAGDKSAVSDGVAARLAAGNRMSASGFYPTIAAIATTAVDHGWLSPDQVGVTAKLPDALTGGAFLGAKGGPLLVTSTTSLQPDAEAWLSAHKPEVSGAWIFGGTGSVSPATESQLDAVFWP